MQCEDIEISNIGCWCDPLDITYSHPNGALLIYRAEKVKVLIEHNKYKQTNIGLADPKNGKSIYIKFKKGKRYYIHEILFSKMEHI